MQAPNDFVANFINEAKSWIGTPYKDMGIVKGFGADCAGFIIGTFLNCGINYPFSEIGLEQSLNQYFIQVQTPQIGDILLFQSSNNDKKHLAVLIENNHLIHAHWDAGIVENTFGNWFKNRLIAAYRFIG